MYNYTIGVIITEYKLTSSQLNFYTKNNTLDSLLWNQVVIQIFPKIYSRKELNDAYNMLIKDNDGMRVRFKKNSDDDDVVAYVDDFRYTEFPFLELSSDDEINNAAKQFLNSPVDFFGGELIKAQIFHTPTKSGVMTFGHHIVVDGFSAFICCEHINKYLKDEAVPECQHYSQYVEKENQYKLSKRFEASKKFWIEQFSDNPITDYISSDSSAPDFHSEEVNREIPINLFTKAKQFCEENEISIPTFFNTVFAVYLHRKYGNKSFTIGVPILNRTTHAELNTIGLYMHALPLVINVANDSFLENAKRIENSWLNLFRHQKFTQNDIKNTLLEKGDNRNSLFDFVIDYLEVSHSDDYEMIIPHNNYLSVPVDIHIQSFDENFHNLKIRYRTAFFDCSEIEQIHNSIFTILENVLSNPHQHFADIQLASETDLKQIDEFNKTAHSYDIPDNSTLYSLFENAAKNNEEKICISADGKSVTFREFLNIAERTDYEIRKATNGKKSIIGVICDRSIEMYAAVYGIIRGGNAYLPISPEYPQDRINYILSDSNAPLVLTQGKYNSLSGTIPYIDMTKLCVSDDVFHAEPCCADESDTAYVIYTSGSTGKPKGAKVSHKSAVNRILWMEDLYSLDERGTILQKTPYTFDVSVWELFWWGIKGKKLAASKPGEHFLPSKIIDEIYLNDVTHLHFVPSVFDLFISYMENHKEDIPKLKSVKHIFLSGEALSASLIERFYALCSDNMVKLHNLYGPTECAVDVTYYDCKPGDNDSVPIGKPIYNTQIYIVDKYLKQCPIGVKGELLICGINVGQGYLNNPSLTKEKFIANPFGKGTAYKTGDLAYWRNDGEIIFCGRIDGQIKLHGQRIEIGEIEYVLNSVDGIENSAVTVKNINGQELLCAYYCGKELDLSAIKSICEKSLPKYMVPSAFTHLSALPLNASGKLDRKALINLAVTELHKQETEEPVNEIERLVCESFEKTLSVGGIGRKSDFFDLGGTSLSMITLLSDNLYENISAADFIANPTPEKISKLLYSRNENENEYKYIKKLYLSETAKKAIICFPYAGGGAEAFALFSKALADKTDDFSLFFIDFLRNHKDCENAAREIALLSDEYELYFYSHCAGATVAMDILNVLEDSSHNIIKHYITAGFIPAKEPVKDNFWNTVSDDALIGALKTARADFTGLEQNQINDMLLNFRKDTDYMTDYFGKTRKKIQTPISVIISKTDIFTENYTEAKECWLKQGENISDIHFIETDSHYFQRDNCNELLDILFGII